MGKRGDRKLSLKLKKTISNITEDLKKIADRKRPVCKSFKSTYSIGASSSTAVDIPITIPAGYEFCMATIASTGKAGVLARDCFLTGTKTVRLYVDNVKATEQTGCEARVNVLFMPENSSGGGIKFNIPHNRNVRFLRKEVCVC